MTTITVVSLILISTLSGIAFIFLGLWLLPLIPFAISRLANNPNKHKSDGSTTRDYKVSHFGFFTRLQPGQVKIIERGGRFIRAIMRMEGKTFEGLLRKDLSRSDADYWNVVDAGENEDAHPVLPLRGDAKWWHKVLYSYAKRTYGLTGFVFTGFYPWQQVLTQPMDRLKTRRNDSGETEYQSVGDYTDHFRIEDFQFPVTVTKADTKDKIPVTVQLNFIGRVLNAYRVAYATDENWSQRLASTISARIAAFTKVRPLDEILSGNKDATDNFRDTIVSEVDQIVGKFGMTASDSLIEDISVTDLEMEKRLGDEALANVDMRAAKTRAIGAAAGLRELAKAMKLKNGPAAAAVHQQIETAKAAGDNAIVMLGTSNSVDPLQVAILRELQNGKGV